MCQDLFVFSIEAVIASLVFLLIICSLLDSSELDIPENHASEALTIVACGSQYTGSAALSDGTVHGTDGVCYIRMPNM